MQRKTIGKTIAGRKVCHMQMHFRQISWNLMPINNYDKMKERKKEELQVLAK